MEVTLKIPPFLISRLLWLCTNTYSLFYRQHVFADLQPYVCTFQDCPEAMRLFTTRTEWFKHEMDTHRRRWRCMQCSSGASNAEFHRAAELRDHFAKVHPGRATAAQIAVLVDACELPIKTFDRSACPFCSDWEPRSAENNTKEFSRHLARHLQQLAVDALPRVVEGLVIRDPASSDGGADSDLSEINDSSGESEHLEGEEGDDGVNPVIPTNDSDTLSTRVPDDDKGDVDRGPEPSPLELRQPEIEAAEPREGSVISVREQEPHIGRGRSVSPYSTNQDRTTARNRSTSPSLSPSRGRRIRIVDRDRSPSLSPHHSRRSRSRVVERRARTPSPVHRRETIVRRERSTSPLRIRIAERENARARSRDRIREEEWAGITKDWTIVDVPPGTERVRMDGVGGASAEVTWQKYCGVRRSRFIPDRDRKTDVEKRAEMWTEITKDLVIREAIEEMGYEYEETEWFFYISTYMRYVSTSMKSTHRLLSR